MHQIINKNTNEKINVSYQPTKGNLVAYYGEAWADWIEVPAELIGKDVVWDGVKCIEKPIDIEELRQRGISYYISKAEQFKSIPIEILVNKSDNSTITVKTDLLEKTLNNWVVVAMKVGEIKKANVINASTNLNEIISVTDTEILRIRAILTELVDNLTVLDVKVTNKIKTASNELILAVFTLMPEQLEQFSAAIMQNAESILQMTDEEFDLYLQNLLQGING